MEVHDKENPVTIREAKGEVLCRKEIDVPIREAKGEVLCRKEIDVPTRMTVREEIRNWIS